MTDYKLSPATSEEAETLNDKIHTFVAQQVSFHGNSEVLKDYLIKKNSFQQQMQYWRVIYPRYFKMRDLG